MSQELRNEARQREAERMRRAAQAERLAEDLTRLANTPEGCRVFRWLLEQGDIFSEDYQPGYPGAYRAGRKAAALRLWNLLESILPHELFAALTRRDRSPGRERLGSEEEENTYA